jgi:phage tail sheath protein FI
MAISLVSPGVKVTERDFTSVAPSTGTVAGAFTGQFRWGPVNEVTQITSENELATKFGKPNSNCIVDFLCAGNFLNYTGNLYVVRAANTTTAFNAVSTGSATLVENIDDYNNTTSFNNGLWIAKYPGALGNSLKVSVCSSANAWQSDLSGTYATTAASTLVVGTSSAANTEMRVGDYFVCEGRSIKVASITNTTHFTLTSAYPVTLTGVTGKRRWEYYDEFAAAPGTSASAASANALYDELHVAVVDEDAAITGTIGLVLEKYEGLSKGVDARSPDGGTNYYKDVINARSQYIYWVGHDSTNTNPDSATAWGTSLINAGAFGRNSNTINFSLSGGADGTDIGDTERLSGYDKFESKESVEVSVIIAGQSSNTVINSLISDIAEIRKDAIVTFSPPKSYVVNVPSPLANLETWFGGITRSTYGFADTGWKYQYDRYNDTYVYVPLNPDIAGVIARNDGTRDPWLSPAGTTNGVISNVVKLAYNPSPTDRDALYKISVNAVLNKVGRGTVLYGDKTFITKNQSLNRINVRKLFIELQKTITATAESILFDQNDATTRSTFVNLVTPYLRSVQARRGIVDFRVICNETNNTEDIVNSNGFVADIFVQPIGSVNFIQLNFVSVRGAAAFAEIGA